ncbi:hypothetical protein, partial [Lysinibacillus sp. BSL11]
CELSLPSKYRKAACNFSSALYLAIKKMHLQLLDVSNNWGAVHDAIQHREGFFKITLGFHFH